MNSHYHSVLIIVPIVTAIVHMDSFAQVSIFNDKLNNNNIIVNTVDVISCSNGSILMTSGGHDNEGRVEICTDGIWMTTEAYYWSYNNAKVVCRQLGYYDTCKNILTCNI